MEGGSEYGKTMACKRCADEHHQLAEWLTELEKYRTLKYEVADWKASISCENTDYYTGYMSALSVFEGMIAEVETINEEEWIRRFSMCHKTLRVCNEHMNELLDYLKNLKEKGEI